MVEKLVPDFFFLKTKIEYIAAVSSFVQFVFIASSSQGRPKHIETKVLTTCFYFI